MEKIIGIFASLMMLAGTASAQYNIDWQTGGGYYGDDYGPAPDPNGGGYNYNTIDAGRSTVTLFNGGHEDSPLEFTVGYVNKSWSTNFGNYSWNENLWGERDKRLHGFQVGVGYNPCMPVGLGIRTGLYYEAYISESKYVRENGWDDFTEHNIYIPLHAQWRIPFTYNTSLTLYGGLGFNYAFCGSYNERVRAFDPWLGLEILDNNFSYQGYGYDNWPHRYNFSAEFGASLRIDRMAFKFTYSKGLTKHHFYDGYATHQNKIGVSVSFLTNLSY